MIRSNAISTLAALTLAAAGCTNARADTQDSGDPVHCLVIFGLAVNAARTDGDDATAAALAARATALVKRNGGSPWLKEVAPDAMRVATAMEATPDERATLALLDDCIEREDRLRG